MREVIRFCFKLSLCVLLALAAGFGYLAMRSGDPIYTFYEWMSPARFKQYDDLVRSVAMEHHLDPMLVKAIVWRESRFDPKKHGAAGERGLMQVSEKAANEWARENKIDNFRVEKLKLSILFSRAHSLAAFSLTCISPRSPAAPYFFGSNRLSRQTTAFTSIGSR